MFNMRSKKLDCTKCGLCCISLLDQTSFCDVEPEDVKKLTTSEKKHIEIFYMFHTTSKTHEGAIKTKWRKVTKGPFKTHEVCTCYFLQGSPLHETKCKIYERRPETCKNSMNPGEKACIQLRKLWKDSKVYNER